MKKWAVISKSDKDPSVLEKKSLSEEIRKLMEDGYEIVNKLGEEGVE